jgi:predicted transposase YbfD/YdcC
MQVPQEQRLKGAIFECFSIIDDPRAANASYPLIEVLFCVIVALCCGADGFVQAEKIAKLRKPFIKKYVSLRGGVPSHDVMGKVFAAIDPEQFVVAFAMFMERLTGRRRADIINLDGKALRGVVGARRTRDPDAVAEQVQMVNAFSTMRRVVLGQVRSEQVASEVKAAQELLELLDLRGSVVTADAAHMNRETLEIIAQRGGNAVIAVKGNRAALVDEIEEAFRKSKPTEVRTEERTHGTKETRIYEFVPASGKSAEKTYPTLTTFVRVTRENVSHAAKQQRDVREMYYVMTFPDVELGARCIRERWAIENGLHNVLDVAFREDHSRIRAKNAAENFSRARHIAFGLLSMKKEPKLSFPLKRIRAAMDDRYLASVLRLP